MGTTPSKIESKWFPEYEANLPSLEGKTIAITGCTSGTGYVVARTCIKKNADNVLLLNRISSRSEKAESELKAIEGSKSNIETIPCDLQDFESVKKAAEIIKSKYPAVDVLCANAGVMALEDKATKDGYDIQVQTNHLSQFMLMKDLMPCFKKAVELRGSARIAIHSSSTRMESKMAKWGPLEAKYFEKNGGNLGGNGTSMFFGSGRWIRYHQTKLANAVLAQALNDHLEGTSIAVTVAEPGFAKTNLQETTNQDGGMGSGMWIMRFSQTAEDGSMPILNACFDPNTESGKIWAPKSIMTGPAVLKPLEPICMDKESREMLWKKSEEACGEFVV
jgi:NAD(P)-dependent dehydrogenase (short-subunit alcohol dehydrogenase family)